MTLWLDASATLALVLDEPGGEHVERLMAREASAMTAVNYGETIDVLIRRYGVGPDRRRRTIRLLVEGGMDIVPVTARTAERAAELRGAHYHRSANPLSFADCVLLAATAEGDQLVSGDRGVLRTAKAEGIGRVELRTG